MSHRGTPSSPIPIDDSEDEVLGTLCVQEDDELDPAPLKRKRDHAPAPPQESKKARKRRRRLEREATMLTRAQEQQRWYADMSSVLAWNPVALYQPAMALYPVDDEPGPSHRVPEQPSASDWVSAMALAGSLPNNFAFSTQYPWPPTPPALLERVSSPSPPHRLPRKPLPLPLPQTATAPVLSIGMIPDNDPNSKHGLFSFGPNNLMFNGKPGNYVPNPSCTIVMEQLPKIHRTIDFCKQWAKRASGVVPLCIFVNPSSANALVEFPSAKFARKAWESPRLGTEYLGLKAHQLKGKPRTDLIRVWWYRVDGVGAGAGVGEIEEGEIEDDAVDRNAQQPESKKARKARLARERLERAAHRAARRALAETVQPEPEPGHQGDVDSIASSRGVSVVPQDLVTVAPDPTPPSPAPDAPDPAPAVVPGPAPAPPDPVRITTPAIPDSAHDPVPTAPDPVSTPQPFSTESISANLSEMKRALLAKQRELEEAITKSKLEMSQLKPPAAEDNRAMEDRLRKLVLQSQKGKASAPAAASTSDQSTSDQSTPPATGESIPAVQAHASDVSSFSLEDLAVSFITETISTLKQLPPQPPPPRQNSSNVKEELAARQKRLEEYITESKMLMTQLTQARTRQERDRLLGLMRDKSRLMDEEKEGMAKVVFRINWPTMSKDGGIMIISDDESEEEEE
ncbi:hypothetical protein APHAL10511_006711 [Amanita phalloides]|nr:hypothetical protein APHAL10511_006711 [Amanita phalloides]